jgi:hypothetical protein
MMLSISDNDKKQNMYLKFIYMDFSQFEVINELYDNSRKFGKNLKREYDKKPERKKK